MVVVPEEAGKLFLEPPSPKSLYEVQMERIINVTHSPPIQA